MARDYQRQRSEQSQHSCPPHSDEHVTLCAIVYVPLIVPMCRALTGCVRSRGRRRGAPRSAVCPTPPWSSASWPGRRQSPAAADRSPPHRPTPPPQPPPPQTWPPEPPASAASSASSWPSSAASSPSSHAFSPPFFFAPPRWCYCYCCCYCC